MEKIQQISKLAGFGGLTKSAVMISGYTGFTHGHSNIIKTTFINRFANVTKKCGWFKTYVPFPKFETLEKVYRPKGLNFGKDLTSAAIFVISYSFLKSERCSNSK